MTNLISTTGTQVFYFSSLLDAPLVVTEVILQCPAGSSMAVDWISIQDGALQWPPTDDLNLSWEDTDLPGGGASNMIVVGGADGLYTGSDEGGLYWFDGTNWMTLNGVDMDLWAAYDQAAWDVLPVDTNADDSVDILYTVTGDYYAGEIYGGLWYSDDYGVSWNEAFDQDSGIAAMGRIHSCDPDQEGEPARGGGHLLARDDTSEAVFVGSHAVGDEGVYLVEEASLATSTPVSCALSGLPAGALPSALVLTDDGSGGTLLLVGLKGEDGTTDESLYTCEVLSGADCSTNPVSCTAVTGSAELDVRDIEVDPLNRTLAYVASGGRFTSSGTCSYSDGSVWEWDVVGAALTDVTDNLEPPIDGAGTVLDYAAEVVGVAMDPDGDYLLAFFPGSHDLPYYRAAYGTTSNAKVWRAATADLGTGSGADWEGLQGTDGSSYTDRRAVVGSIDYLATGVEDLWLDDQLGRETWAPSFGVDAVFWDDDADPTTAEVAMVADGFGIWLVDGMLTDPFADVDDDIVWTFWFDRGNTENLPQTTVVHGLAAGPSGALYTATRDIGASLWDPGGTRGAEVPCWLDRLNAPGRSVSVADIPIPSMCKIDGGNLSGVRVVPWTWTNSSAARLLVWGAWQDRTSGDYGGVCTFSRTGSDPQGIVNPGASSNRFDIDDVLPHPWMDRVMFVQPSVKAVTRAECGTTCAVPTPLIIESLRDLGSPNFTWHFTETPIDGLQSFRGGGLTFAGDGNVEYLYYGAAGTGVHRSSEISDATW